MQGQGPAGAAAAAADKASEKVAALEIAAEAAPAPPASPSRPAADASADRPAGSAEAFAPPPPGDPATPDGMDKCLDYALLRAIASVRPRLARLPPVEIKPSFKLRLICHVFRMRSPQLTEARVGACAPLDPNPRRVPTATSPASLRSSIPGTSFRTGTRAPKWT